MSKKAQFQVTNFEWSIHEALTASDIREAVKAGRFVARWSSNDPVSELSLFPADSAPTEDLIPVDAAVASLNRRIKMFLGVIN